MKFSRVYMLSIVAFLAVVFVAEYRMPRRFNWHPSFSAKSTQPFGSQLFDSVLKATLPNGYQVTRQTLYQLEQADTTRRQTVLVVADHLYNLENIDVKTMLRMAERGNKIILVAHGFSSQMEDTMGVYATTDWSSEPMQMGLAQHYKRDSLILWKRYGTPIGRVRSCSIRSWAAAICWKISTSILSKVPPRRRWQRRQRLSSATTAYWLSVRRAMPG